MDVNSLNPDKNLYSVAPVGPNIIIGRQMCLKGGLDRKRAINLLAWLMIATKATGAEIRAELKDATTATGQAPAVEGPTNVVGISSATQEAVRPFIGSVDAEEQEALQNAQGT
jgi:hypothetical protein